MEKRCLTCKKEFYVRPCLVQASKYCSRFCYSVSMQGSIPWNKGTKGIMKPNKTSFKKGNQAPKSAFKKGEKHRFFKGEINHRGYILVWKPKHPFSDSHGRVKRSHLVMEKHLKRYLEPGEIVHHINHIRNDDRVKNLMLFPNRSKHQGLHEKLKKLHT